MRSSTDDDESSHGSEGQSKHENSLSNMPSLVLSDNPTARDSGFEHKMGTSGSDWEEESEKTPSDLELVSSSNHQWFEDLRSQHYRMGNLLRQSGSTSDEE